MNRAFSFCCLVLFAVIRCGGGAPGSSYGPSRTPVSVRGWIADIVPPSAPRPTDPLKLASWRNTMFQDTSVVVLNIAYASGGVSENGSFIVLDVPPGEAVLDFTAPGVPSARLAFSGLPPNADVLLPGLIMTGSTMTILHPEKILVRVPSEIVRIRHRIRGTVLVGSYAVDIYEVPLSDLADRRDYPEPAEIHPLATVR